MAKVIVHVNQHVIAHNRKHDTKLPTLTIKHPQDGTLYAHEVMGDAARVVDCNAQGRAPLSCGARVWVEYGVEGFGIVGDATDFPTLKRAMKDYA